MPSARTQHRMGCAREKVPHESVKEPSLQARVVLADAEGAEGGAAYEAALDLQEAGFVNAVVVRGGMKKWQQGGFAMEEEAEEVEG